MIYSFVGDVHGNVIALEALLKKCHGHIIFMGDLIDRGPHSREVIAVVRQLCASGQASCIIGNHEFALVSSLGAAAFQDSGNTYASIDAQPEFFTTWKNRYGGMETLDSYGCTDEPLAAVAEILADDVQWLRRLPWLLEGNAQGFLNSADGFLHSANGSLHSANGSSHSANGSQPTFLAVHAGFNDSEPFTIQRQELVHPHAWWSHTQRLPPCLYEHHRARENPPDLPANICVVSGHSVQKQVYISTQRILCDTSGGHPGRQLSAVIWPENRVVSVRI